MRGFSRGTVVSRRFSLSLLLFGALLTGCLDEDGEEECTPAPLFCNPYRPSQVDLTILTGGGALQEVRIYRGSAYETGILVWSGNHGGSIRVPLGTYSATATYLVGGKTVIAVDGDDLYYSEMETCDGTCYDEVDGEVDLALED
jgi:hypothetical protein